MTPKPRKTFKNVRIKANEIKARSFPDGKGNILIAKHYGHTHINMSLKLASEKKRIRHIGTIMKKERELILKRNRLLHIHYKMNSYGFHEVLIKDSTRFDIIVLRDEFGEFRFPKSVVIEHGKYAQFSKAGFELQLFVPLPIITQYQVESSF